MEGCNFVIIGNWLDFQKNVGTRMESILQMVLKFQVVSTLFHSGEAVANISGKRRRNSISNNRNSNSNSVGRLHLHDVDALMQLCQCYVNT